nr:hypothetical protein GCM10020063_030720 [Dactylosporangium thailandense]
MAYLTAAVVLLGAVTVLNLVLLLGVVQRMRRPVTPGGDGPLVDAERRPVLPPGERPAPFAAAARDGEPFEPGAPAARLVGFFSPHCNLCHDRMPGFLQYARRAGLDRSQVFAVVVGAPEDTAALTAGLAPAASVVDEPDGGGSVYEAFGVRGLPAMYLLDPDGVILASGTDLGSFPDAGRLAAAVRSGGARASAGPRR